MVRASLSMTAQVVRTRSSPIGAHRPPEHQGYLEAEELLYGQARAIGESTESVIRSVVASTPFLITGLSSETHQL
jgi:hypothetical protein